MDIPAYDNMYDMHISQLKGAIVDLDTALQGRARLEGAPQVW